MVSYVGIYLQGIISGQAPCIELSDGNKIPTVALGTGRGTAPEDESIEEVRKAVFVAIEAGYRHIDTAEIYGDEEQVGLGIADAFNKGIVKREDIFVTTKLWSNHHAKEQVIPALKESLRKLGLQYADLYLIHFPLSLKEDGSADNIDYLETWKGMEDAKRQGLANSIGVSNFNAEQIDRLLQNCDIKPVINEIEVNPTLTQVPLVDHCQRLGIAVMAYSPFGFLVGRSDKNAPPPRMDDPILVNIANKYGKHTTQVVLRYLIDRGMIPIPKSTNSKRIAQNIDLFDFALTPEEIETIGKFNKNIRVIKSEAWKDYPYYPFEKE